MAMTVPCLFIFHDRVYILKSKLDQDTIRRKHTKTDGKYNCKNRTKVNVSKRPENRRSEKDRNTTSALNSKEQTTKSKGIAIQSLKKHNKSWCFFFSGVLLNTAAGS